MAEYINRDEVLEILAERTAPWNGYQKVKDLPAADVVERRSCNTCKYYEGVHHANGRAPCSFWKIGGVMWKDFCSRWKGKDDG